MKNFLNCLNSNNIKKIFINNIKIYFCILGIIFLMGCINKPKEYKDPKFDDFEKFVYGETKKIEDKEISIKQKNTYLEWQIIKEGLKIREYPIIKDNIQIDIASVVMIDPNKVILEIHQNTDDPKIISDWHKNINAELIFNGGYFKDDNLPTGGLVINKKQYGFLTKDGQNGYTSALISNNQKMDLIYLPQQNLNQNNLPEFILQSFPTIIEPQGKSAIKKDSQKKARRTIFAKTKDGNFLVICTSKASMSLYEIMNFLLNTDLNIDIALNLDGGQSTGMSIKYENFKYEIHSFDTVPNIVSIKIK